MIYKLDAEKIAEYNEAFEWLQKSPYRGGNDSMWKLLIDLAAPLPLGRRSWSGKQFTKAAEMRKWRMVTRVKRLLNDEQMTTRERNYALRTLEDALGWRWSVTSHEKSRELFGKWLCE